MRKFDKPVIDVEQQIKILKDRGLAIQGTEKAKLFLHAVSFFRLSAYMRPYQVNHDPLHRFNSATTFKQITQTYEFDRKLRLLVMAAIERLEVSVRAVIGSYLGPKYNNPHWYLERIHFKKRYEHDRLLQTIERKQKEANQSYQRECVRIEKARDKSEQDKEALKARRAKESYARHYPLTYSEPSLMPGWAMLEELTLGDLSHLYAGLAKDSDKKAIAKELGLSMPLLESWLKTLTTIRNICAHHGRFWNRELGIKPELPKDGSIKWPDYQRHVQDNTRTAVVISILQYFITQISPHDDWKHELIELFEKYVEIDLAMMGFPSDWKADPFWN
tara:strand:+ start:3352 stop:4347 length:996 start_codon:yes stop_codon:yes gene_type:complete